MNGNMLVIFSLIALCVIGFVASLNDQPVPMRENPASHCLIHGKTYIDEIAFECELAK